MSRNKSGKSFLSTGLHNLFYNNKYLLIFSVIAAIVIWIAVVMRFSPESTYIIKDVPVTIDIKGTTAEKLDLHPFTETDYKVDVTIKGKRYAIKTSEISADNFVVSANLNYVDSVGLHTLQLVGQPKNKNAEYEISQLSIDRVDVYFDAYKEVEVDLKTQEFDDSLVSDGYLCDGFVASENSITLCGASTQINKLDKDKVYAVCSEKLSGKIDKTTQFDALISFVDLYGNPLNYVSVKDNKQIVLTAPILKIDEFATGVEFKNMPANYDNYIESIVCSPSTVKIGAAEDVISTTEKAIIGTIDFSSLKVGSNNFVFKKSDISNLKILSDTEEFTVTVNVFEATKRVVSISDDRITFTNNPGNCTATLIDGSNSLKKVVILGSENSVKKLDIKDVYAVIDLSTVEIKTGRTEANVKIVVNNEDCWAYGSYTLPINIVETGKKIVFM